MKSAGEAGLRLETKRMILTPYTPEVMRLALKNLSAGADSIGAHMGYTDAALADFTRKIYGAKLILMERTPSAWLLCTAWQMVLKNGRHVAGECGFKGPPDNGEIEIGYGTRKEFRNLGLMTEAVSALCGFAFSQKEFPVCKIVATTLGDNYASHRTLRKCGFNQNGRRIGLLLWEKTNSKASG